MVLYCLFAVPIFSLFILSCKLASETDTKRLWVQFSRGLLVFVPAYLIYLIVGESVPLTFSATGIFGYYFFHDALLPTLMATVAYILIQQFSKAPNQGSVSEAFIFFAGYFTFASVLEIVRQFPDYNAYLLFLFPTLRLAVISAFGFLLARFFGTNGWVRWIYLPVGLAFLIATALVPFFYVSHFGFVAIIVTVALLAAALFPYVVMSLQGGRTAMPGQPSPIR